MTGICGHISGVTCSNCRTGSGVPGIPTGYEIRVKNGGGYELLIGGQPFPWAIDIDGPLVEGGRYGYHILWVPILVNAPMSGGRPDGEPLNADGAKS